MATVFQNNTNEEEDQPSLSAPMASGSAPMGQPQAPAAAPQRQGSSSRPNVNQYLQANQGAGQQLAQGIQSKVNQQASALNKNVEQTGQQLEAKANPLSQELGEQGQQKIQTAFQDPQSILQNQQQLQQFQKLRDQGASTDIQAFGQAGQQALGTLQGQQRGIEDRATAAQTEGGRFGLLRNTFGQPTYSRGQQRLDQLFLQAQPGAARGLQQGLKDIAKTSEQKISGLGSNINQTQANLSNLAKQRAEEIQSTFGQGMTDIGSAIEQKRAMAPEQIAAARALDERIAANQLTAEDVQALGLNAGQKIYNLRMGDFVTPEQRALDSIGAAEFASPEEFARYNALMQLSAAQTPSIFGSATEAGTYKPYQFNTDEFNRQLSAAQQSEQDYLSRARDAIERAKFTNPGQYYGMEPIKAAAQAYLDNPTFDNLQKFTNAKNTVNNWTINQQWAHNPMVEGGSMTPSGLMTTQIGAAKELLEDILPNWNTLNPNNILLTPEMRQQLAQQAKSNDFITNPLLGPVSNEETMPSKI